MTSSLPSRKRAQVRLTDVHWEPFKELVYREFIVNGKSSAHVIEELGKQGLEVTANQLEHRLEKWNFSKKMSRKDWLYVHKTIKRRKRESKQTVVVYSGRRMDPDEVNAKIRRHVLPTLKLDRSSPFDLPSPPNAEVSLYPCTPRDSSPSFAIEPYHGELPFFNFIRNDLPILLKGMEFSKVASHGTIGSIEQQDEQGSLARFAQHGFTTNLSTSSSASLFSQVTRMLVRYTLHITTRSEELALELYTRQSVDCMAAQFDIFMPKAQPNDNLRRAVSLTRTQDAPQVQVELLKILVYIFSNHLVRFRYRDELVAFARQVTTLCHFSGLSKLATLQKLVHLSLGKPTLTAVIRSFFDLAVWAGATSFVATLLQADGRISPNAPMSLDPTEDRRPYIQKSYYNPLFPLEAASKIGQKDLILLLLQWGASPDPSGGRHGDTFSILALAILSHRPPRSYALAELLINGGANIDGESGIRPIHAALMRGDQYLLKHFIKQGAQMKRMDCLSKFTDPLFHLDLCCQGETSLSCLALAAAGIVDWEELWQPWVAELQETPYEIGSKAFSADREARSYQLCSILHQISGSQAHFFDEESKLHAVTIAADRGHAKTLSFLLDKFSINLNTSDKYITPIHAAVNRGYADILDELICLGACTSSRPRDYRGDDSLGWCEDGVLYPPPTLLQLAVIVGSFQMVSTLLGHGVDVNERHCIIVNHAKGVIYWPPGGRGGRHNDAVYESYTGSALSLAVDGQKWDIVNLLLDNGASGTIRDLVSAATHGSLEMAKAILESGVERASVTGNDVVTLFRLASWDLIQEIYPDAFLQPPSEMQRDTEGRSYLENAILSGDMNFITSVLALDQKAYDSGSLCALVSSLVAEEPKLTPQNALILLNSMLLPRRESAPVGSSNIHPDLENIAIVLAAQGGRLDVVELLLASRHLPRLTQHHVVYEPESYGLSYFSWVSFSSTHDWHGAIKKYQTISPFDFAVHEADESFAKILLQRGYRPYSSALATAIEQGRSSRLIEGLIMSCWDINAPIDECNEHPLYHAMESGHTDIVESLLGHNADINAMGYYGDTFLSFSISHGNPSLAQELIVRGADVNLPASCARKPLSESIARGYFGLVQELLHRGAKIETRKYAADEEDLGLDSDLQTAAIMGRLDILQLLLNSGAETTGYARFRYICAVKSAEQTGQHGMLELLKDHRLWTEEDQILWKEFDRYQHLASHPSEMPLWEFIDELATHSSLRVHHTQSLSLRTLRVSVVDIMVAAVVRHHAAMVSGNQYVNCVKEEAARVAVRAIRHWLSENGTPGPSSIWGVEGLASLDSNCSDCNSWQGYYFGCECSTHEENQKLGNLLGLVAIHALQGWAPCRPYSVLSKSYTKDEPDFVEWYAEIKEDAEADGQPSNTESDSADSLLDDDTHNDWQDASLNNIYDDLQVDVDGRMDEDLEQGMNEENTGDPERQRREPISDDMIENHETPTFLMDLNCVNNNDDVDLDEERRRAILEDMKGIQEAPLFPTDCGI